MLQQEAELENENLSSAKSLSNCGQKRILLDNNPPNNVIVSNKKLKPSFPQIEASVKTKAPLSPNEIMDFIKRNSITGLSLREYLFLVVYSVKEKSISKQEIYKTMTTLGAVVQAQNPLNTLTGIISKDKEFFIRTGDGMIQANESKMEPFIRQLSLKVQGLGKHADKPIKKTALTSSVALSKSRSSPSVVVYADSKTIFNSSGLEDGEDEDASDDNDKDQVLIVKRQPDRSKRTVKTPDVDIRNINWDCNGKRGLRNRKQIHTEEYKTLNILNESLSRAETKRSQDSVSSSSASSFMSMISSSPSAASNLSIGDAQLQDDDSSAATADFYCSPSPNTKCGQRESNIPVDYEHIDMTSVLDVNVLKEIHRLGGTLPLESTTSIRRLYRTKPMIKEVQYFADVCFNHQLFENVALGLEQIDFDKEYDIVEWNEYEFLRENSSKEVVLLGWGTNMICCTQKCSDSNPRDFNLYILYDDDKTMVKGPIMLSNFLKGCSPINK